MSRSTKTAAEFFEQLSALSPQAKLLQENILSEMQLPPSAMAEWKKHGPPQFIKTSDGLILTSGARRVKIQVSRKLGEVLVDGKPVNILNPQNFDKGETALNWRLRLLEPREAHAILPLVAAAALPVANAMIVSTIGGIALGLTSSAASACVLNVKAEGETRALNFEEQKRSL